jgi:hypothetical protein
MMQEMPPILDALAPRRPLLAGLNLGISIADVTTRPAPAR